MENEEVLLKRKNATLMHTRLLCYFYLTEFSMCACTASNLEFIKLSLFLLVSLFSVKIKFLLK